MMYNRHQDLIIYADRARLGELARFAQAHPAQMIEPHTTCKHHAATDT